MSDCVSGGHSYVAGVDGCRRGWIVVHARCERQSPPVLDSVSIAADFAQLMQQTSQHAAVAIDIPIGLSEGRYRAADFEARRFIGPRRSSVFPAPARGLLERLGRYQQVNELSRSLTGRGISQQAYNLLPKICDADAAMTPALQARVVESHPEVCFCALNGCHLGYAKRERGGVQERLLILERLFGPGIRDRRPPPGAALDDLYDAAVLVWTAFRVTRGEAQRLPEEVALDSRGLRMEIVY